MCCEIEGEDNRTEASAVVRGGKNIESVFEQTHPRRVKPQNKRKSKPSEIEIFLSATGGGYKVNVTEFMFF